MKIILMGMERSMMKFKWLSTKYWAKAVHTAFYLRNRSPTSALDGKLLIKLGMVLNPR
jgi:hypothetical protein